MTLAVLVSSVTSSYAEKVTPEIKKSALVAATQYLETQNLPVPDGGINIVSRNSFKMSKEMMALEDKQINQLKTNGTVNEYSEKAQFLINFPNIVEEHYKKYAGNNDDRSTHMRNFLGFIKFAFTFPTVNDNDVETLYGYAPGGSFVTESESPSNKEGWTEGAEYFKNDSAGVCVLMVNPIKVTHASTNVAKESINYAVNNKVTILYSHGNASSGYLYSVKWFDETYFRELDCATPNFDRVTMVKVVEIAKGIDNFKA